MNVHEAIKEIKTYNFLDKDTEFIAEKGDKCVLIEIKLKGSDCITFSEHLISYFTVRAISVYSDNRTYITLVQYL